MEAQEQNEESQNMNGSVLTIFHPKSQALHSKEQECPARSRVIFTNREGWGSRGVEKLPATEPVSEIDEGLRPLNRF